MEIFWQSFIDAGKLLFVSLVIFFVLWHEPFRCAIRRWTFFLFVLPLLVAFVILPWALWLWAAGSYAKAEAPNKLVRFINWWLQQPTPLTGEKR